jgi:hypothetical protein
MQVAPERADRVDPDLIAERLEHVEVGVRTPRDPLALADQLAGEGEGGPPLADPARSVEEVGVCRAVGERGAQERLRLLLLRKGLEAVHE